VGQEGAIAAGNTMHLSPILRMKWSEQEREKKMLEAANWLTCVCFLI
jgi:hypothetical protein